MTDQGTHILVDAWPVLEWLQRKEPAASRFDAFVERASRGEIWLSMSRINHGEVIYLVRKNFPHQAHMLLAALENVPVNLLSVPDSLIDSAVDLKSRFPISFADAFGAAQAIALGIPLLTGDREFRALENVTSIELYWVGA